MRRECRSWGCRRRRMGCRTCPAFPRSRRATTACSINGRGGARAAEVALLYSWPTSIVYAPFIRRVVRSNHVCFLLEEEGLLFSGDHVLDGVTPVILPPDGDMAAYLHSLELLKGYRPRAIAPGHGRVLADPIRVIDAIVAHRARREAKVVAVLGAGGGEIEELLPKVYDDVRPELLPIARYSLEAHLLKLQARRARDARAGRVVAARWRGRGSRGQRVRRQGSGPTTVAARRARSERCSVALRRSPAEAHPSRTRRAAGAARYRVDREARRTLGALRRQRRRQNSAPEARVRRSVANPNRARISPVPWAGETWPTPADVKRRNRLRRPRAPGQVRTLRLETTPSPKRSAPACTAPTFH